MIGTTLDYGSTERYIIGTAPASLEYVGGVAYGSAGQTVNMGYGIDFLDNGVTNGIEPIGGDLVIACFAINVDDTGQIAYRIANYTQIQNLYVSDTEQVQLQVGYRILPETPSGSDFIVTLTGGTGDVDQAVAAAFHVWRNVDPTNPFDVTATWSTSTNTARPNAPSITPITSGAVILVAGGGGHANGVQTFSASELDYFETAGGDDTHDATVGLGSYNWTSGAFDPTLWSFSGTNSTAYAAAAVTMALRPIGEVPVYGNLKNSGIWNLPAVFDDKAV
jgi:hypothetical protein